MPAHTIFVGSLPASASNERLEEIFCEIGPVKQCFVVRDKGIERCRGFGYVTYSMEEDAQRALKEITEYDGKRISLSVAKKKLKEKRKIAAEEQAAAPKEKEQQPKGFKKKLLKARLIIRNLSFKVCLVASFLYLFCLFFCTDGKKRGFAFVGFKNVSQAAVALKAMNMKEIKGRQVAVDWAVPKDRFIATQHSSTGNHQSSKETNNASGKKVCTSNLYISVQTPPVFDRNEPYWSMSFLRVTSKAAVQQVEESQSDDEADSEEQEEDAEEEVADNDDGDDNDNDNDDKSSLDSNDEQDESQDDEEDEEEAPKKTSKKLLPSDVNEGKTIFIRLNLSFDTEEEGLEEVLLQYGELNYVKIVLHPDTEHSKGCAFAQFKTIEAADRCIAAAQDKAENGGIRVDGRKLLIVAAVSREDAAKLKVNKVKVETGTRNLYLAREGLIRAGTKAAEGVPEADMIKRTRFEEIKRAKLRDVNVFVSKIRLCVHNLPKSVDNKKLKALCLQAVKGNKGVWITECRVMYDRKPQKGQVMGQSLGYGFVQFQDHEHALSTLRYLNNNPDIFGPHKRPIVEFSLEDSRKLKIKEMRQQKNKVCLNQLCNSYSYPLQPVQTEKSTSQGRKNDRHCSGFQTNPEVEHIDLENGKKRKKVLPLPSHRGPKIRMRDKGKQQTPPAKKSRPGKVKGAKKNFKSRDGDRFDSLVEQYKKKLLDNSGKNASIKKSKWFDN
uniref:RNA binding motif protein 28 n=1 Tax=Mastacembelus armatus TaxID=205130 RepID=A0A7N8YC65_9TELE